MFGTLSFDRASCALQSQRNFHFQVSEACPGAVTFLENPEYFSSKYPAVDILERSSDGGKTQKLRKTSVCATLSGYGGDRCEDCMEGFYRQAEGRRSVLIFIFHQRTELVSLDALFF